MVRAIRDESAHFPPLSGTYPDEFKLLDNTVGATTNGQLRPLFLPP